MTCFMPPIQRKKKVDEKYNPDTFRVISEDAVSDHPKYRPLPYRASFEPRTPTPKTLYSDAGAGNFGKTDSNQPCIDQIPYESRRPLKTTRVLPHLLIDHRSNRPQARSVGFLDRNVRFLNEPICNVYTRPVQHEESKWWPSRANPGELVRPPYAEDTHYRSDYNYRRGERPEGSGRHTSNPNLEAALGTIPVNYLRERDGSQRFYKEGLSYEHMYNSRWDQNYPNRGKRHGAFVWNRLDPISQKKFIEYHQRLNEEEAIAMQNGEEGPLMRGYKTGSAPVIRSSNYKHTPSACSKKSSALGSKKNGNIVNGSVVNGSIVNGSVLNGSIVNGSVINGSDEKQITSSENIETGKNIECAPEKVDTTPKTDGVNDQNTVLPTETASACNGADDGKQNVFTDASGADIVS